MDQVVVTQATYQSVAQSPVEDNERHGVGLITLARMEIGGTKFALPLSDVAAVIEPAALDRNSDDPDSVWIGHVHSQYGSIAVANGSALIGASNRSIPPSRIAVLRGSVPVGIAVDRMLSAQAAAPNEIIPLSSNVPVIQPCPVVAAIWDELDELELVLDRESLVSEPGTDSLESAKRAGAVRSAQQRLHERYGSIDFQHSLEVHFDASPERWVIPTSAVRLVTESREAHPLPRTPQKVAGVVAWQRKPIPVIDPSFDLYLPRPVSPPAHYVVVGEPVSVGETSTQADAAIIVDRIVGTHNNLRIEHGYAWDTTGDALNIMQISDILS